MGKLYIYYTASSIKIVLISKSVDYELISAQGIVVRSPSGKNWQDRDKANKISISFPATPNDKFNVFGDVMKIFEKFMIPRGEITVPNVCSCFTQSLYLIMKCWDIFQRHGLDNR